MRWAVAALCALTSFPASAAPMTFACTNVQAPTGLAENNLAFGLEHADQLVIDSDGLLIERVARTIGTANPKEWRHEKGQDRYSFSTFYYKEPKGGFSMSAAHLVGIAVTSWVIDFRPDNTLSYTKVMTFSGGSYTFRWDCVG